MKKFLTLILTSLLLMSSCTQKTVREDDIYIFFTSDVHCGISEGLGYASLKALVDDTKAEHEYVSLVDCGDYIQGGTYGSLSRGSLIIEIMNAMDYDIVTFGNHEFDYGIDRLRELDAIAEYDKVASNVIYKGSGTSAFADIPEYIIKEYGNTKVAFLGILTPTSLTTSTPASFMEDGKIVYDFYGADEGEALAEKVQSLVDETRAKGADYVILLSHLGSIANGYDSISLIARTSGIDAVLDGHSHSVIIGDLYPNKDGEDVLLSSVGTRMENAGELIIARDGSLTSLLISEYDREDETISRKITEADEEMAVILSEKIGELAFPLTITDEEGIRMVRCRETNLGDLCCDAIRYLMDTDVALCNGGGIRKSIPEGAVTYGDLLNVFPFQNDLSSCYATGQQIIDALEFGARMTEGLASFDGNAIGESGAFLQVSGLRYTIDTTIPSPVIVDGEGMFKGIEGQRRVSDVLIFKDGEYIPIDPKAVYTVAASDYVLFQYGDGNNVFAECEAITKKGPVDLTALIDYFEYLGEIPKTYKTAEGRISVK